MTYAFIFPSDSFNPKGIDEFYLPQAHHLKNKGFPIFHINTDDIEESFIYQLNEDYQSVKFKKENMNFSLHFIYRGWMLNQATYEKLNQKFYYQLKTDTDKYLFTHHLPNWYHALRDYTMKSIVTSEDNIVMDFSDSGFQAGFIKDYVKSIKTGKGSIIESQHDIENLLQMMKQYKGHIEGGLVIREKINLQENSETRHFVLNDKLFSPDNTPNDKIQLAQNIQNTLKKEELFFYSIDIAYITNNTPILIEVGDGQVSDYTGWDEKSFLNIFNSLELKNRVKFNG